MAENYDFLGIGDIVTDAFIQLKDPSAHIDIDHEVREICMRFADKIPYENVTVIPAVGNSANATVAAARLGLSSALAANVGGNAEVLDQKNLYKLNDKNDFLNKLKSVHLSDENKPKKFSAEIMVNKYLKTYK